MDTRDQEGNAGTSSDEQATDEPRGWVDTAESLTQQMVEGLLYTHTRVNADSSKLLETSAFMYAAIELLAERGLISIPELEKRKNVVAERLIKVFMKNGMGMMLLEPDADKYTWTQVADVDCVARIPICKAACCRMSFAMSSQDVQEGIIRWEPGQPYMNRREADGYCHHLDRRTFLCTVRDDRPIPCRAYSCRNDKGIWKDFDKMEPQSDLELRFRGRMDGQPGKYVAAGEVSEQPEGPALEE